jgi:hypothetical protein
MITISFNEPGFVGRYNARTPALPKGCDCRATPGKKALSPETVEPEKALRDATHQRARQLSVHEMDDRAFPSKEHFAVVASETDDAR